MAYLYGNDFIKTKCVLGEIYKIDESCEICPPEKYSLIVDSTECIPC